MNEPYIIKVPVEYNIVGLDSARWLMVTPAENENPLEAHPISELHAWDLMEQNWGTGSVHHDRADLEAILRQQQEEPYGIREIRKERPATGGAQIIGVRKSPGRLRPASKIHAA